MGDVEMLAAVWVILHSQRFAFRERDLKAFVLGRRYKRDGPSPKHYARRFRESVFDMLDRREMAHSYTRGET